VTHSLGGSFFQGTIPAEFTLDYFYPFVETNRSAAHAYRLYLSQSCTLRVTNVFQSNSVDKLFPGIPSRVNYQDRRFMNQETPEWRFAYTSDKYLSDSDIMQSTTHLINSGI
jgi:hypothetical protein